jgi:predicted CXXCH cytochrome family protein
MPCGNSCHISLAYSEEQQTAIPKLGTGCKGCHLFPTHHANDTGPVIDNSPAGEGWYRFLAGHPGGANPSGLGVTGIEDDEWQANANPTDHNEYLGWEGELESHAGFYNLGNIMTAFCCGCHGNFHEEQDSSGSWLRHPSDAVIQNVGEYANAFGANGTGTGTYDPLIPVARPNLSAVSPTVAIGTDLVMCLSCHRPHGSPYYKLMRWDYKSTNLSTALSGCSKCHTSKD